MVGVMAIYVAVKEFTEVKAHRKKEHLKGTAITGESRMDHKILFCSIKIVALWNMVVHIILQSLISNNLHL